MFDRSKTKHLNPISLQTAPGAPAADLRSGGEKEQSGGSQSVGILDFNSVRFFFFFFAENVLNSEGWLHKQGFTLLSLPG